MVIIIPRRRRGTWTGVPMATWCSEWIRRMRAELVHHIIIIPAALSLPLLQGAVVGFENLVGFYISKRLVLYQNLQFFLIASPVSGFPWFPWFPVRSGTSESPATCRPKVRSGVLSSWAGYPVRTSVRMSNLVRRTRFGVSGRGRDTLKKEHIYTLSARTKKSVTRPLNNRNPLGHARQRDFTRTFDASKTGGRDLYKTSLIKSVIITKHDDDDCFYYHSWRNM